jgi:hypothetical protein
VNRAFGGVETGTSGNPFRSVGKSAFAVRSGSSVIVVGGSYPEQMIIDRPLTIYATGGTVTIGQ